MGGKRKSKRKAQQEGNAIAEEELKSLEAIYGEDLQVDSDRHGFCLCITPNPAEPLTQVASTVLVIRLPLTYPAVAAELRVKDHRLLTVADQRALSKQLHALAAELAAQGAVCCYDVIESCRIFLQDVEVDCTAEAPSLWHQMQQREEDAQIGDIGVSKDDQHKVVSADMVLAHGDLFDDGEPEMESLLPNLSVPLRTSGASINSSKAAFIAAVQNPNNTSALPNFPGLTAAPNLTAFPLLLANSNLTPGNYDGAAAVELSSASRLGSKGTGEVSGSIVRSVLGAVRQGFSAVSRVLLPPGLQRALDSPIPESSVEGICTVASTEGFINEERDVSEPPMTNSDVTALRRDLLMGHLLAFAMRGTLTRETMPTVAASIQELGIMPTWVQRMLTQQPQLFDRAFSRLFEKETKAADANSLSPEVLRQFWKSSVAETADVPPQLLPPGLTTRVPATSALPQSRYLSDFQEVRQLGKGAFGAVLLATNRLDKRQYAIKRIEVEETSAIAFDRLLREVTTLSRLQHAHVVRYYQAWFEVDTGAACKRSTSEDDSAWLSSHPAEQTSLISADIRQGIGEDHTLSSHAKAKSRSVSFAIPRGPRGGDLPPVIEETPPGCIDMATASAQPYSQESEVSSAAPLDQLGQPSNQSSGKFDSFSRGFVKSQGAVRVAHCSSPMQAAHEAATDDGNLTHQEHAANTAQQSNATSSDSRSRRSDSSSCGSDDSSDFSSAGSGGSADSSSTSDSSTPGLWQRWERHTDTRPSFSKDAPEVSVFSSGDFSAGGEGSAADKKAHGSKTGTSQHRNSDACRSLLPAPKQLLFIQMEFCPRTLRQVLDDDTLVLQGGSIDNAAAWLVVRQILSGLSHIHSQGIIHRDLNPSNIFYDARGDIRLGDFGLAKFTAGNDGNEDENLRNMQGASEGPKRPTSAGLLSDNSGVMGTSFYIAPEVEQGQVYSEKVDLYSLGILTYELWAPFTTAMERVLSLRELRQRGKPPPKFYQMHKQVAHVVERLMSESVLDRPTAREVLTSDMLPPSVEDQALTDILRSLPNDPDTRDRVAAAVFASSNATLESPAADFTDVQNALLMRSREGVMSALRESFGRHGAVASSSSAVKPSTAHDESSKAWLLMTPSGAKLALRHQLRRPFLEHLAHRASLLPAGSEVVAVRRYEIEAVQRRERGRSLPSESLAADFDIVGPRSSSPIETALPEAEAILAVTEAVAAVAGGGPHCEVRLSHAALVTQAIAFIALPGTRDERSAVIQTLTSAASASLTDPVARSKRWQTIRIELEGLGLTGPEIGRCRALVLQLPGSMSTSSVEVTLERLRLRLCSPGASKAAAAAVALSEALDHLKELAGHLEQWGITPGRLFVDPLIMPTTQHHSLALWQLHLVSPGGNASLLARGGRYDALLEDLWLHVAPSSASASTSAHIPGGVGTTVNVDRLVSAASDFRAIGSQSGAYVSSPDSSQLHTSQSQVLVCSKGGGKHLLRERMALTAHLWSAGLRTEFLPLEAPSTREQYEHARAAAIPYMVTIEAASFSATDTVVVKSLERNRGDDRIVPRTDVARFLHEAISAAALRRHVPAGSAIAGSQSEAAWQKS